MKREKAKRLSRFEALKARDANLYTLAGISQCMGSETNAGEFFSVGILTSPVYGYKIWLLNGWGVI